MTVQVPAFCTDQSYDFSALRMQLAAQSGPGVVHAGDFAVTPGSGLQVNVAAGFAYVQQTVSTEGAFYKGLYFCPNDAPANPFNTISAPLSNPRIDQVVLRVYDVSKAQLEWNPGSENASASLVTMGPGLSNPGMAALPANSLQLAYVLQTVGESSISSGNIVNAATAAAFPPFTYVDGSANLTAVDGQWIEASGVAVALPSPTLNAIVAITARPSVNAAHQVAVSGTSINGRGLSAATSFKLGSPGASVVLQADGTSWYIVAGEQDTGWLPLTLVNSWGDGAGSYAPAYKLTGNTVRLRGLTNNAGTATTVATLPAIARPASGSNGVGGATGTNGNLSYVSTGGAILAVVSGQPVVLDNFRFDLS